MDIAFESLTILDLWSNDRFIILYDYTCNIFVVTVIFYDLVEVSFNWYFNFIFYETMLAVHSVTVFVFTLILFLCIYFFVYIIMLLSLRTLIDIKDSFLTKDLLFSFWIQECIEYIYNRRSEPKDWNFYLALYGRLNKKIKHFFAKKWTIGWNIY